MSRVCSKWRGLVPARSVWTRVRCRCGSCSTLHAKGPDRRAHGPGLVSGLGGGHSRHRHRTADPKLGSYVAPSEGVPRYVFVACQHRPDNGCHPYAEPATPGLPLAFPGVKSLSDAPKIEEPAQEQPGENLCKFCGGNTRTTNLLDARKGKMVRLVRCTKCDRLNWTEGR
jgi:hypothetical protein